MTEWDLEDLYGEGALYCRHGYANNIQPNPSVAPAWYSCKGIPTWAIRYQPAPGDGFADNAPSGPLGSGNSTTVTIAAAGSPGFGFNWGTEILGKLAGTTVTAKSGLLCGRTTPLVLVKGQMLAIGGDNAGDYICWIGQAPGP